MNIRTLAIATLLAVAPLKVLALNCLFDEKEITYYLGVDPIADRLPGGETFLDLPGLEAGAVNGPATPQWLDTFYLLETATGVIVHEVITINYATATFDQTPFTDPLLQRHTRDKELTINQDGITLIMCVDQNAKGGITNNIYFDNQDNLVGFFTNPWHDLGGYAMGTSNETVTIALAREFNASGGDAAAFLRLAQHYTGVTVSTNKFSEDAITLFQTGVAKSDTRERAQISNEDGAFADGMKVYRTKTGATARLAPSVSEVLDQAGNPAATNRILQLDNHLDETLNFHTIDGIKNVFITDGIGEPNSSLTACVNGSTTLTSTAANNFGSGRTADHVFDLYLEGAKLQSWTATNISTNLDCDKTYTLKSYKRSPQRNTIPGWTGLFGPDQLMITSLSATPSEIEQGGAVTVSWSTTGAQLCTASSGFDGWAGSTISLPSGNKILTGTDSGTFTFSLVCFDNSNNEFARAIDVTVSATASGALAIDSFTASAAQIVQGGLVSLSWSTSNADSCAASGGFGGWDGSTVSLPSGSKSLFGSFTGTFTFLLSCQAGFIDTVEKSLDVTVSTTPPPSGNAAVINTFDTTATQIAQGGSATLSWSTTNAVSCDASGGFGGWGGSSIDLPSGAKTITGSFPIAETFFLSCQGDVGTSPDVKSLSIAVGGATPPDPDPDPPGNGELAITSFTPSEATVLPNQAFALSWTTTNAISCKGLDGAGGWATALPVSGEMGIIISTPDTYTFTLRCENADGFVAATVDVIVINTATSQVCEPSTSLALTAVPFGWSDWWATKNLTGVPEVFPAPLNEKIARLDVGQCGYNYVSFNTANAHGSGAILLIPTTSSDGLRLGSISAEPGDFGVAAECRQFWGLGSQLSYSTSGLAGVCQLAKNTDYYLNFTFTNGTDASTSDCTSPVTRGDGSLLCEVEVQAKFIPNL